MRMDKIMELIIRTTTTDELGGEVEGVPQSLGSIKCLQTPVNSELLMKDYGLVSTKAFKIFTMDTLPNRNDYELRRNDIEYKILQINDYKKYKMLLVEEADHD